MLVTLWEIIENAHKAKPIFRMCRSLHGVRSSVDFLAQARKTTRSVNRLILFIATLLLGSTLQAGEKKHYVLYATLTSEAKVEMADGSQWIMDKGDTFPVVMFKQEQTKIVLQLAGTNFTIDTVKVKTIEETAVTPEQLATYRNNVQHYLDGRAKKWKAEQAK